MLALSIYDDLKIRLGTPEDMPEVMGLAVAAATENGLLKATPALLAQTVWPKLNLMHGMIGCIGRPDGMIEGMVVLQIGKLFYSDETCLEELVLYVHPDYRNARGGRAGKLIEFSKSAADRLGLPLLIGVLSSAMTEQKCKLYERVLGPASGKYWIYGRKTGVQEQTQRVVEG
jgi:GNAT superfamily N-acetyltransferase